MKTTEQFYEFAQWRYKALAKEIDETTPPTDERITEMSLMTEIIKDYRKHNMPFAKATVADIIRCALEENKMTQRQLALELGVSTTRVNDYVSGKAEPSLKIAAKICKVLHIPTAVMMSV